MRFNKNAHCFAVEPSGWRFTFDASIFVTLFRRFAPSDSPRVHQWHSDFIAMPQLCLPFGKHNFTLAQAKISPPKAISFALSDFHSFNLLCNTKHSFLCGNPSGRLPRYARNDIFLSATCRRHTSRRRHIAFAKGKNIASSLLRVRFFCFFAKEKPSEIRTVFCCLDLLFFVEQCLVGFIAFC